jgi:hypothetical protein
MKVCTKCRIERTLENSWKGTTYCKKCYNEWKRGNRVKHKDNISIRKKIFWKKINGRPCKECGENFVGKGLKRDFCSTRCRLLGTIIKKNGCWEWQDKLHPNGYAYATMYETNKKEHVHRISYRVFKGEIPEGLYVCHHCDNKKCLAPDHLFLGSAKDNMQDALKKGRLEHIKLMHAKGEKNGSSKLKEYEVQEIKKLILEGVKIAIISRKFNVSWSVIDSIKRNKTWRHVLLD